MTWEWVTLISVIIICTAAMFICFMLVETKLDSLSGVEDESAELQVIKNQVAKLVSDHELFTKQVDEGKKILSEVHLAAGFKPRGR